MAKKHGQSVHGWVNLDKPVGMSSAKVVGIVRRELLCRVTRAALARQPQIIQDTADPTLVRWDKIYSLEFEEFKRKQKPFCPPSGYPPWNWLASQICKAPESPLDPTKFGKFPN